MEAKLVAWARSVKARQSRRGTGLPPLWIFADQDRLPDPRGVLLGLPKGLCGLVLRGRGMDARVAAGAARICVQRRFAVVVAGDLRVPGWAGAGQHMSGGVRLRRRGCSHGLVTAPAHGPAGLVRARRLGARGVFLSPVFPTASHPGAPALGVLRWAGLARRTSVPVLALGGVTGAVARRLPRCCAGAGMIGAAVELGRERLGV